MKDNAKAKSNILSEILLELNKITEDPFARPFAVINQVSQLRSQLEEAIKLKKKSLYENKVTKKEEFPKSSHQVIIEGNEAIYVPGGVSTSKVTTSKM